MEKDLVRKCIKFAKENKWMCIRIEDKSIRGTPDACFIKKGRTVWVEFKSPTDERKNELQRWTINRINDFGGEGYFGINNVKDFIEIIVDNKHTNTYNDIIKTKRKD